MSKISRTVTSLPSFLGDSYNWFPPPPGTAQSCCLHYPVHSSQHSDTSVFQKLEHTTPVPTSLWLHCSSHSSWFKGIFGQNTNCTFEQTHTEPPQEIAQSHLPGNLSPEKFFTLLGYFGILSWSPWVSVPSLQPFSCSTALISDKTFAFFSVVDLHISFPLNRLDTRKAPNPVAMLRQHQWHNNVSFS